MPELGPYGSVRGALSNERPYRDLRNVVANYPFERSERFPVIQPNSGRRDYSRSSCDAQEERVVRRGVGIENKHRALNARGNLLEHLNPFPDQGKIDEGEAGDIAARRDRAATTPAVKGSQARHR
jgi:hypothetical protein